jgi:hypothetical protein
MTGSRSIDRLEGKSKGFRHITPCGTVPFSSKIINGENNFGTIWTELDLGFSEFAVRDQELPRPLPPAEEKRGWKGSQGRTLRKRECGGKDRMG